LFIRLQAFPPPFVARSRLSFRLPARAEAPTIGGSMDWACLAIHPDGVILRTRLTPNASRSEAIGLVPDAAGGQRLALRVRAPAVEGQANEAARRWIAQAFGLRPSVTRLARGERSRQKDFLLVGLTLEAAEAALERLLAPQPTQDARKKNRAASSDKNA
jgi:uncharacterized protein YggU (UPF0235/DUF167 family)